MSTSRHQFAGAPGTGTTVDNMQSRVKMWSLFNQQPATPVLNAGFNVSSLGDDAVGQTASLLIAPFAGNCSMYATGAMVVTYASANDDALFVSVSRITYRHIENSALLDTSSAGVGAFGALA
jgi:hypothetical protein